jgi:hypothetical protein
MAPPSGPRYQGSRGLSRWPPISRGTRSAESTGALRIRSTPLGFARVPRQIPPGFTRGMNTSRTDSSIRCRVLSQRRRTAR